MTHDQLAKRIADVALLRGEFTLRSGRKSTYYLDKYRFETIFVEVVSALATAAKCELAAKKRDIGDALRQLVMSHGAGLYHFPPTTIDVLPPGTSCGVPGAVVCTIA